MVKKIKKRKKGNYVRGDEIIKTLEEINKSAPELVEHWVNERFPIIIKTKQNKLEKIKKIFGGSKKKREF